MNQPQLAFSSDSPVDADVDVVVIGAQATDDGARIVTHPAYAGVAAQFDALGVTGAADEIVRLTDGVGAARAIAVVGIGRTTDADALRAAAGSAVRQLTGIRSLAFALETADADGTAALAEGAALGSYAYTAYRHASLAKTKLPATDIRVHAEALPDDATRARIRAVTEAVALVKDLVNMPPADLYPASFAERVSEAAASLPLEVTVWDETDLARDGFGGILGVGQGSARPPRLVRVAYSPQGASTHLALVGKGITFDTGGLSLKPMVPMIGMKADMAGAADVLAATVAAATLGLPVRLTAWLCLAENMPSGNAVRPNDVLRFRDLSTVEVVNTDAEGRLVLADGLIAASEEHPDAIIDVATLTGAQVVALGHSYSAVMGDDALVTQVLATATNAGERMWPMPLPAELRRRLDSDIADLKNATPGDTAAGMLLAGVFLREFIGTAADGSGPIPWAHLDIAGTALHEGKPFGHTGAGATGVAVRTLIGLAEHFARR